MSHMTSSQKQKVLAAAKLCQIATDVDMNVVEPGAKYGSA